MQKRPQPAGRRPGNLLPADPGMRRRNSLTLGPYVAGIQLTTLIAQGLALNETHLYSARRLFNEFRAGYARTNPFTTQSDFGHNSSTSLGYPGPERIAVHHRPAQCDHRQLLRQRVYLPAGRYRLLCLLTRCRQTYRWKTPSRWTRSRTTPFKFGFRYVRILASPFTNTTTRGGLDL